MKKLTLIAASAVLFNVNASDVEIFDETVDFGGMYIGAGIGGEFAKNKVYGSVREGVDALPANTRRATFAEQKLNDNRFIGSVVLGAGRQVNKVYFGAEAMLDMGKSKIKAAIETVGVKTGAGVAAVPAAELTRNVNVKSSGFKPVLAARLGYVIPSAKTMVYAKAGVAFNKVKGEDISTALDADGAGAQAIATRHDTVKNTKASFVAGLGVEKMFCNKFSARLEGDYNFGAKKDFVKKYGKGFTVRALVAYNVKF